MGRMTVVPHSDRADSVGFEAMVKYELWDDLIAATTSGALDWTDQPAEQTEKHHGLGLAYAAKGDAAKLVEEITSLQVIVNKEAPKAAAIPRSGRSESAASSALSELEGYQFNAKGDYVGALDKFSKATLMRPEALARAHLLARNFGLAEAAAKKAVEQGPGQFLPIATLVDVLHTAGKEKEAREACKPLMSFIYQANHDTPIYRRIEPVLNQGLADSTLQLPTLHVPDDDTMSPDSLGSLVWTPNIAAPFSLKDTDGKPWSLADHKAGTWLCFSFWVASVPTACSNFKSSARILKHLKSSIPMWLRSVPMISKAQKP